MLYLPAELYIIKDNFNDVLEYTIQGYTARRRKFEIFIGIHQNKKSLRRSSITPLEVYCKDFVNIYDEKVSFLLLEDSVRLIYFFTTRGFWFMEFIFSGRLRHDKLSASQSV